MYYYCTLAKKEGEIWFYSNLHKWRNFFSLSNTIDEFESRTIGNFPKKKQIDEFGHLKSKYIDKNKQNNSNENKNQRKGSLLSVT